MQTVIQSLQEGLAAFFSYIPQLIGAILILIVGYIIAKIAQAVVRRVLEGFGFEDWMERGGVKRFFERAGTQQTPSSVLGKVAFWFVFIIAITMAANALGIQQISGFLNQLIAYIPSIFAAILILFLAGLLANFIASIVRGATGSEILGTIAQYAIIIYAAFAALTQLGIAVQLTAPTFLILLGAVALAAAIAFGWGARNVAQDIVERAYHRGERTGGEGGGGTTAGGASSAQWGDAPRGGESRGDASSTATAARSYAEGHDLIKVSETNFILDDPSWDLRGRKVYARDGQEIGEVEDLYTDTEGEERRLRFLSVSAGGTLGMGKKHFLIPVEAVSEADADRVRLDQERDRVTNAPQFAEETHPDRRYQVAVYSYYGYT